MVTGTASITWLAGDADGDEFEYAILYSTDDGGSWQALTSGWRDEGFEVDAPSLSGSDQAQVLATDGRRETFRVSRTLKVLSHQSAQCLAYSIL